MSREEMFPVVRRAIERACSKSGAPVSRDAVVAELVAMPEIQAHLGADAQHGSGRTEWTALGFLLAFDQSLITGGLPQYEAEILRITGRRGAWSYQLFLDGSDAATAPRAARLDVSLHGARVRHMPARLKPASAA